MTQRRLMTPAVVLRMVDHGERNRIVTLFSRDLGRLSCVARHARGSKRRFGGHLDIIHCGEAELHLPKPGGLAVLRAFTLQNGYASVRADIVRFAIASFFVELVHKTTADGDVNPAQFELLTDTLEALDSGDESERRDLILGFQLRWFDRMGLLPILEPETLLEAGLPALDEQPLSIARALLSGMAIPELDAPRFRAVGALTHPLRNRVLRRPLESGRFLAEMLDADT